MAAETVTRPVRLRLYEVTFRMWGQTYARPVSARSPSAAKYRAFLDADLSMPFRDYQRACSVRLHPGQPADDGYGYVRRYYGVDPHIGQRITLTDEGAGSEGRGGEVVYPYTSRHYVHVVLDGDEHSVPVHPRSIVLLPAEALPPSTAQAGGGR